MIAALRIANFVLLLVNVGLFLLWFSLIRKDALPMGGEQATYVLNQVSVQVTVLGIMVAFGGLLLAGLGIFGFQAVMERATAQAERAAQALVARRMDEIVKSGGLVALRTNSGPLPKVEDAKEAEDPSDV